jgi:hypothetical protein
MCIDLVHQYHQYSAILVVQSDTALHDRFWNKAHQSLNIILDISIVEFIPTTLYLDLAQSFCLNMACPKTSSNTHDDADDADESADNDEDIENRTIFKMWQDFLHSLTLHGFRFIFEPGPIFRRIVWLAILLCAIGMVTFQSKKSIQKYIDHPITTSVQVEFLDEIAFPAVTICNFNLFPYYLINGTIGEKARN